MSRECPPVVLHIPHASALIPDEVRPSLVLTDPELEDELLAMTDWHTEELFAVDPAVARMIVFPVSRLVVDPERFVDDEQEEMAQVGMGVVYTRTSRGRSLRAPVADHEKAALIEKYYEPHHGRLTSAVGEALETHGHCMIIDCHSFPTLPLSCELDQRRDRPDVCIGTDEFHTSPELRDLAVEAFRSGPSIHGDREPSGRVRRTRDERGLKVELNRPFSGSLVPMEYYGENADVQSIMIEIRRGLYMDEVTGERLPEFGGVGEIVGRVIGRMAAGE